MSTADGPTVVRNTDGEILTATAKEMFTDLARPEALGYTHGPSQRAAGLLDPIEEGASRKVFGIPDEFTTDDALEMVVKLPNGAVGQAANRREIQIYEVATGEERVYLAPVFAYGGSPDGWWLIMPRVELTGDADPTVTPPADYSPPALVSVFSDLGWTTDSEFNDANTGWWNGREVLFDYGHVDIEDLPNPEERDVQDIPLRYPGRPPHVSL